MAGGIAKEINEHDNLHLRHIFSRSFTGIVSALVFGLSIEHFSKSVMLAVSVSALMGVWGFESLVWITKVFKNKIENGQAKKNKS
jgi:ABC-type microcin C transport system permease subunit YejE